GGLLVILLGHSPISRQRVTRRLPPPAIWRQIPQAGNVDRQTEDHADTGDREPPVPAIDLANRSAGDWSEQRANIDADVPEAVRRPAPWIIGGIQASDLAGYRGQK